jgi:hypothetical protein
MSMNAAAVADRASKGETGKVREAVELCDLAHKAFQR